MKKLLIIAPLAITLAACSSNPLSNPFGNKSHAAPAPAGQQVTDKAYDTSMPKSFRCEDGAMVQAKYSADGEQAMITASLPKANWNNQELTLSLAPSGSGSRYVNNVVSQNVNYEWHTKADMGIMSLKWKDGSEYSVTCDAI